MKSVRAVVAVGIVLGGLWFIVAVFGPGAEPAPARSFTTSAQCKECHPTQYAEWEGSQHSISWTNPLVRGLSNEFANQDCIACHAPRPVFVTEIGERVLPRTARRTEGVDCIACHQLPDDGGMAATVTDRRAACRPVERIELTRPDFCAGCHNQHKTVDQWRESDWPEKGEDCLSCHMPPRDPSDPSQGRDHTFLGGNDLAMLQRAVVMRGERRGDAWVIEVENVGAGHAFPTDERSRASDLFWRPTADVGGGPDTWRHLYRIRDPYRTETDIPSTLLHAGTTKELHVHGKTMDDCFEALTTHAA